MKTWRYFDEVGVEGVTVVRLRPSTLGASEAGQLYEDLLEIASQERDIPDIVVNLRTTKFLSSDTLGALLAILPKLENRNGRVVLADPQPMVQQLLDLQRLTDLFNVFPNEEEAVNWCRSWRLAESEDESEPVV